MVINNYNDYGSTGTYDMWLAILTSDLKNDSRCNNEKYNGDSTGTYDMLLAILTSDLKNDSRCNNKKYNGDK